MRDYILWPQYKKMKIHPPKKIAQNVFVYLETKNGSKLFISQRGSHDRN